jgi:hypothetical protein
MPGISYEILTNLFRDHLPFTPTAGQVALFQSDLGLLSPFLMEAALKEVKAGTKGNILVYRPEEWRPAIFTVYNRKVAEHAQLFPIFHSFETAFRSTVAVTLERHYRHPRWWAGIHAALRAGRDAASIRQIGGTPLTRDAAHVLERIVLAIDDNFSRNIVGLCGNGYEFAECCDLSHIGKLIETHWPVFGPMFVNSSKRLTQADFRAKFARVRDARNDVYHHKSVARMTNVVATAEELLDYLGFSLAFVYRKITESKPSALTFSIPVAPRHRTR